MTDSSSPVFPLPQRSDVTGAPAAQLATAPAAVPLAGAVLAGAAVLASIALMLLLPRFGGRLASWRNSIAGLRLLAPPRDR